MFTKSVTHFLTHIHHAKCQSSWVMSLAAHVREITLKIACAALVWIFITEKCVGRQHTTFTYCIQLKLALHAQDLVESCHTLQTGLGAQ